MAKRTVPDQYLTIAAFYPKWVRAIATARRAIADVEAGSEDWQAIMRAKDRLHKLVDKEAAAIAPLGYRDPVIPALLAEISALSSIEAAQRLGVAARDVKRNIESKRLREEEREINRPYEWMSRASTARASSKDDTE